VGYHLTCLRRVPLDLYVVTRIPVSVLRDSRLDWARRVREGPEYEALVREGYRPLS